MPHSMLRLVFSFPVALVCSAPAAYGVYPPIPIQRSGYVVAPEDGSGHLDHSHDSHSRFVFLHDHHHAWIPHEWLSQLTIYAAYWAGGYSGLMAWLCILSAVLLVAGYLLCSIVFRKLQGRLSRRAGDLALCDGRFRRSAADDRVSAPACRDFCCFISGERGIRDGFGRCHPCSRCG